MEDRKCYQCGNLVKDNNVYHYELKDGKYICIKCFGKISEKEKGILLPQLKNMCMSENDIDNFFKFVDKENKNSVLRIVSWNCHWGLDIDKYFDVLKYYPEVLIIQECTKNDFDYIKNMWKYKNWYNDDLKNNKSEYGVAVFSNDYKISFTEIFNRKYRYVIPYMISKKDEYQFTLFAVWINPIEKNYYIEHFNEAVDYYRSKKMLDDNAIVIGDFNTFAKDSNDRSKKLEEKLSPMINCASDSQFCKAVTYYDATYGYGIDDFCFVSKSIKDNYNIDINIPDEWNNEKDKAHRWKGLSDHSPIIVNINLK
jgi:endonuclease/exonuclease/phosphatase family metal-dependent hydrolase